MKFVPLQNQKSLRGNSGQVIVEYVLLLIVVVSVATIIVGGLTGRAGRPGVVITAWSGILNTIAQDIPDHITPE